MFKLETANPSLSLGVPKGPFSFAKENGPFDSHPCAAQGNKEQRWRAEISGAQTIEPAQCIDHRKNNDRAEIGGRIILVEPRGNFADVEPADLARAQHMLDERQHDLGVEAERLRRADARGKRGRENVRADGDVRVVALIEKLVHALKDGL